MITSSDAEGPTTRGADLSETDKGTIVLGRPDRGHER